MWHGHRFSGSLNFLRALSLAWAYQVLPGTNYTQFYPPSFSPTVSSKHFAAKRRKWSLGNKRDLNGRFPSSFLSASSVGGYLRKACGLRSNVIFYQFSKYWSKIVLLSLRNKGVRNSSTGLSLFPRFFWQIVQLANFILGTTSLKEFQEEACIFPEPCLPKPFSPLSPLLPPPSHNRVCHMGEKTFLPRRDKVWFWGVLAERKTEVRTFPSFCVRQSKYACQASIERERRKTFPFRKREKKKMWWEKSENGKGERKIKCDKNMSHKRRRKKCKFPYLRGRKISPFRSFSRIPYFKTRVSFSRRRRRRERMLNYVRAWMERGKKIFFSFQRLNLLIPFRSNPSPKVFLAWGFFLGKVFLCP